MADPSFVNLVERAKSGDREARNELLANCRDYLAFVANRDLDHRLRGKCGPSDIVQNTLMNAATGFEQFRGESVPALKAWLREILRNELAMASRYYVSTAKRDIRREKSSNTDSQFWQTSRNLADRMPTPSSEAVLEEDAAELRSAMLRLPEDYRSILLMRNWERLSFQQIAQRLGRTENAAKKLWARALTRLEAELFTGEDDA